MARRTRVFVLTALAAAAVAAAAVAVGALQGDPPPPTAPVGSVAAPRTGRPPLVLDLGVRVDREARALRQAAALYAKGDAAAARTAFATHGSLEAKVGAALATWPDGSLDRLTRLAGLYPRSGAVQLHLALARIWAAVPGERDALEAALAADPDSLYAVTAGDLLYPRFAPGLPQFVPPTEPPAALSGRTPPRQLALLRVLAEESVSGKLHYGVALQRLGRPRSAERVFAAAARAAPDDPDAQVAAAVGRFDKARPAAAFSKLGPLTPRFPERATVRFHLGLLLLWSGEVVAARNQLEQAVAVEPGSLYAAEARRYIATLDEVGLTQS